MRKPNNKGFTMTEVIVAVAIFLILAIPIFSQLLQSVKNNSKVKSTQYGINVAESEMELMKTVDLNAVSKIYNRNDETGTIKYELPATYLNADGTVNETVFLAHPYATPALLEFAKRVKSFKMTAEGVCVFEYTREISNAETAAAEDVTDSSFDVVITLDPTGYDGDEYESSYNKVDLTSVQSLNNEEQAIIGTGLGKTDEKRRTEFWEEEVLKHLNNKEKYEYLQSGKTKLPWKISNYYTSFQGKRTTTITIDKNTDAVYADRGRYKVTTEYHYEFSYVVAGLTDPVTNEYFDSEPVLYFNTVPDVKFYYNQFIVTNVNPNPASGQEDVIFDDEVVFINKLSLEKMNIEGYEEQGYEYYYTDSDLFFVFNNKPNENNGEPNGCRGYSSSYDCTIKLGIGHHNTQKPLNVYYSQTSDDPSRSITKILKNGAAAGEITIDSALNRTVAKEFQPIYDIKVEVTPEFKNGQKTKMEGTRGQ